MADKSYYDENVAVNIPLQHPAETQFKDGEEIPPPYESPQVDFSSGWKDRGFAIAFWVHGIIVIILGLVLGIPALIPFVKSDAFNKFDRSTLKVEFKPIFYGLGCAAAVGAFASFFTFFLLQQCAGRLIRCSFCLIIIVYVLMGVGLFFVLWPLCLIPAFFLLLTLLYITCVRKRVEFAEAHLKAGVAALASQPSLVLIALLMLVVEFLWFVFWFLMVLGIQNAVSGSTMTPANTDQLTTVDNAGAVWYLTTSKSTLSTTPSYVNNDRSTTVDHFNNLLAQLANKSDTTQQSTASSKPWYSNYLHNIIIFLFLLSWYWGAVTFGNIAHFITACSVGRWWFTDNGNRQYSLGNSIKRAFTTNFGTICLGSLFEAIMKALRSTAEQNNNRKSIFSCVFVCIVRMIERVIGYLNEWAFIYSALTGQSFVQASRSFIELFRKRGWTAIINDALIGVTLGMINLLIGLVSGAVGGLMIYILLPQSPELIPTIIITTILSLIIGILMSTIITTILTSCVRTVFVCFAMNPAALGATHPDHLQTLSKVWHKFYPQEFATSGYKYQPVNSVV